MENIGQLEKKLDYRFNDAELLETALTHDSYVKEHNKQKSSNERLEFLGDAFFDAVMGEELYRQFPDEEEGFLSRTRATLVCEKSLANEAKRLGIGDYVLLGNGEERNGGRTRESVLADTMEAILGAIYLDGGFGAVKTVILKIFEHAVDDVKHGKYVITDYKTTLQERLQGNGITDIKYSLVKEMGPDHDKTFLVQLEIEGRPMTEGKGKSKKQAEQNAAKAMLEREI